MVSDAELERLNRRDRLIPLTVSPVPSTSTPSERLALRSVYFVCQSHSLSLFTLFAVLPLIILKSLWTIKRLTKDYNLSLWEPDQRYFRSGFTVLTGRPTAARCSGPWSHLQICASSSSDILVSSPWVDDLRSDSAILIPHPLHMHRQNACTCCVSNLLVQQVTEVLS